MRLNVWAPAPNRHLNPLLDELHRRGALAGAFHLSPTMSAAKQVGGGRADYPFKLIRDLPHGIDRALRLDPGAHNLVISFETDLCKLAMFECLRRGLPYSLVAESLQPREKLSPTRIVRDAIYRLLARRAQAVFAMGPLAATQLESLGIARDKIHPMAYPMPSSPPPTLPKVTGSRIVFCGRLVELKRVNDLIHAIARSPDPVRSAELLIVGDGPERQSLENLARAVGVSAKFVGSVGEDSARAWICTASVLVLPTRRREGWGYVVNEAIEAGIGVVVSDKVGAAELVIEGLSGSSFREMDTEHLSKKLCAAFENNRADERALFYDRLRPALSAQAICDYLLGALEGEPRIAPWLSVVDQFGGNSSSTFWAENTDRTAPGLAVT